MGLYGLHGLAGRTRWLHFTGRLTLWLSRGGTSQAGLQKGAYWEFTEGLQRDFSYRGQLTGGLHIGFWEREEDGGGQAQVPIERPYMQCSTARPSTVLQEADRRPAEKGMREAC